MRQISRRSVLGASVLAVSAGAVLAACGDTAVQVTTTAAASNPTAPAAPATSAPTAVQTTSAATAPAAAPVTVTVDLKEFTITSSLTAFTVGVPYHFEITNSGALAHDFLIMAPTTNSALTDAERQAQAVAFIAASDLPAGSTGTLDVTFTKAYPEGTLELACHVAGHYEAAMRQPIAVA